MMMAETIRPVFKLCASEQTSESKAQSHKWVQRNLDRTEQTIRKQKISAQCRTRPSEFRITKLLDTLLCIQRHVKQAQSRVAA